MNEVFSPLEHSPLVEITRQYFWANPSGDQQFQIKLARVSHSLGEINYFTYMGKNRLLPQLDKWFYIYTMGGLNSGNYNFGSRVYDFSPLDKWVNAAQLSSDRGVVINVYDKQGLLFPTSNTWIMKCFDGTTLIAFPKCIAYPMPIDKSMWIRTYSTDLGIGVKEGVTDLAKLEYAFITFYDFRDWDLIQLRYKEMSAKNTGLLYVIHNGVICHFEDIKPSVDDLIEIIRDPSYEKVLRFKYLSLTNYYSNTDKKRKFILFPNFRDKNPVYKYFDDCDFWVWNTRTKKGIYFHRNSIDAVRQLTHQDYGIASDYVYELITYLKNKDTTGNSKDSDFEICAIYRKTKWSIPLLANSSRINDLYLLDDPSLILGAMTGVNSLVPEWTADELEKSYHNKLLGSEYTDIDIELSAKALGFNGLSQVLSGTPFYMPRDLLDNPSTFKPLYKTPNYTSLGYEVPISFIETGTAYEYDKDGHYTGKVSFTNREYYIPSKGTVFVEFYMGEATTWLDATLTKREFVINPNFDFRVYIADWKIGDDENSTVVDKFWEEEWSISKNGDPLIQTDTEIKLTATNKDLIEPERPWNGGEIAGPWVDVTGNDEFYSLDEKTGLLTWKTSMVNSIGLIVSDSKHLYNEFEISHLDYSIYTGLIHMWEVGGVQLPIAPAQLDIWIDEHPLSENIDYVVDFPKIYIFSKEYLKPGNKHIVRARGTGLSADGIKPSSELGFITNGVIGYNGRYNLRLDRPTRMVSSGRLLLTNSVDWAETKDHGDNLLGIEGYPYEVKHIYSSNRYVKRFDTHWGYEEARDLDSRISAYLTEYVKYKPKIPPKTVFQNDRYILFSPFMNQVYNELYLGFLTIPEGDITEQVVYEVTKDIQWLLKYDPIVLDYDRAYFDVHPLANIGMQPITARMLSFISKVNDYFLKGRLSLRGHFEVKPNV